MTTTTTPPSVRQSKSRLALLMVIAVCLAPVLASYYFYYLAPPEGRTNSGSLILPPEEVQATSVRVDLRPTQESGFLDVLAQRARQSADAGTTRASLAQGEAARLGDFGGRWLLVWVGSSPCGEDCLQTLLQMRQIRLTTGRDRDRVERVWLQVALPSAESQEEALPAGLEGTWVLSTRVDPREAWANRLPADLRPEASRGIWLIDPQGHLMMHFPPGTDPAKIKKDLIRLLKASRIG